MDGVERRSGSRALLQGTTPLERQGANVFQEKQCRNCHSIGGLGGQRGPALDDVATRLTEDQMVRQVMQGGGNMPAYGKTLSPRRGNSAGAFLETLHPANQPAADRCVAARCGDEQSGAERAGGGSPSLGPFSKCDVLSA